MQVMTEMDGLGLLTPARKVSPVTPYHPPTSYHSAAGFVGSYAVGLELRSPMPCPSIPTLPVPHPSGPTPLPSHTPPVPCPFTPTPLHSHACPVPRPSPPVPCPSRPLHSHAPPAPLPRPSRQAWADRLFDQFDEDGWASTSMLG